MVSIPQVAETLERLLTNVAAESAEASGYAQRPAKALSGEKFVQTTVLGFMRRPDSTLEQLAQTAAALGAPISAQGLDQRFTEHSALTLLGVLEEAVQQKLSADPVPIELLNRFEAVEVQDSTVVSLPEPLAQLYPGCGERTGQNQAALKVHFRFGCGSFSAGALCSEIMKLR